MSLDEIDAQIITALIKDARASYAVIGAEVGLSAPAVKRRVDRLRASGAITGFTARVDPAALGWTTEAYVELFCGGSTSPEAIRVAVLRSTVPSSRSRLRTPASRVYSEMIVLNTSSEALTSSSRNPLRSRWRGHR